MLVWSIRAVFEATTLMGELNGFWGAGSVPGTEKRMNSVVAATALVLMCRDLRIVPYETRKAVRPGFTNSPWYRSGGI